MSLKLLKNLQFADIVNSNEAITEAGKELLNNYRAYLYSNPANCSLVNSFVVEASRYGFDAGLAKILESVNGFINENKISWKLASACESIMNNNSTYNYINKIGAAQVEKLLEMNESEVVSYIKAGSLKGIQYIPEFRNICKEVFKQNVTESVAQNYTVINPVSFVLLSEDTQYFKVNGKTYKIEDNKINEAQCDDVTFNQVNALLEGFTRDGEDIFVEFKSAHGDVARMTLNENGLDFTKGAIKEHFDNAPTFMEYINFVSKAMPMNEKLNFMHFANNVAKVFEHMDNIVLLDCAKVLTTSNGTCCAIIEAKDNVNLTVFRSINAGTGSKNYDFVVEALNDVIKISGVDLKTMFESRIDEDCKKQDPEAEAIKEQLNANREEQFNVRKKKIAMLAEQYKNDPVRIALLNKVAKDLKILENK